jgi:hypothetical protein
MSTPNDDKPFPHELELVVRTELTLAEISQPEVAAEGVPATEPVPDPDLLRYEVDLRLLLDALEALQDGSRPGDQ